MKVIWTTGRNNNLHSIRRSRFDSSISISVLVCTELNLISRLPSYTIPFLQLIVLDLATALGLGHPDFVTCSL